MSLIGNNLYSISGSMNLTCDDATLTAVKIKLPKIFNSVLFTIIGNGNLSPEVGTIINKYSITDDGGILLIFYPDGSGAFDVGFNIIAIME